MTQEELFTYFLILCLGVGLGAFGLWLFYRLSTGKYKQHAASILKRAEDDSEALRHNNEIQAKHQLMEQQRLIEQTWQQERRKMQKEEERLQLREDKIEARMNLVEKKIAEAEKRESAYNARKLQLEEEKKAVQQLQDQLLIELEKASGLSALEAKELLLNRITSQVKADAANVSRRIKKEAIEEAEKEARRIIVTAINRLSSSCVSEATISTVSIPNEEMKGRIIGREGRNIRTLENATGVNFIIDDTPGAVVLSAFDPIRKHIAKVSLAELIQDGRIHPTRIEEIVDKVTLNVHKEVKQAGEDAAWRAGVMNLHPEIINLLGKLNFRYSFGQNVLSHSLEVSHLMGMMAAELGLDVAMAKRIGLLHDMGKAVSHEMEGSHALIGYDLALKYGEKKEIANGIGCHHNEQEALTPEAALCSAADSLSASRPGARIEAVEEYIKRLKKLEEIAYQFPGIDKAYALQAGREIRIIVQPDIVDDEGVMNIARDLTKKIEEELNYPGKIKVIVTREKRVVEYAV